MKAWYRKFNDTSHNSSTYHKKDGTAVRAKFKVMTQQEVKNFEKNNVKH